MLHRSNWLRTSTAIIAALSMAACRGEDESQQTQQAQQAQHKPEPPAKPTAPSVIRNDTLDREALVIAVLRAATAAALGKDDRTAQLELGGRKFAVRIRFGCPGIKDPDRSWSYDEQRQVLRVKVRSSLTSEALPASDLLRKRYEGAVGFTLGRPWLLNAGCPGAAFTGTAGGDPTIVIAQLFTDADSRAQRPERDYALAKPLKPDDRPSDGLDLVLSGRLAELSDGRSIHCAAKDGPPACIVSARIDRVAVENPLSGDVLGEWGAAAAAQ